MNSLLPSPLRPLIWNGEAWAAPGSAEATPSEDVRQWLAWAQARNLQPYAADAAGAAVRLLRTGASAQAATAAALIAAFHGTYQHVQQLEAEETWIQSVIDDLTRMDAPSELVARYRGRLAAVQSAILSYNKPQARAASIPAPARAELAEALRQQARAEQAVPGGGAKQPPAPQVSLRELFAENSVLVLGALGAFLLVVATVLFELYGTVGLGGQVRLGAVIVLNLIFGAAGYLARRRKGLEAVGQVYIALAAVLLPLVGVAAWTFLDLHAHGIAVYQAVAVTGAACSVVYGILARRLDLRAYGEIAGVAVLISVASVARWAGGDYWMAAGVGLGPLVFATWERVMRARVFSHFQWFAHASAVVAVGAAVRYPPNGWLWTATLATLAFSYLAWQAIAGDRFRAWVGEAAAILAGAAASLAMGIGGGHFVLPMLVAIPLIALSRQPELFGIAGRLYRPHIAHLHLAVGLGLVLAAWEYSLGGGRSLAAGLVITFGLYATDYYLEPTEISGYTLRGALVLALMAIGRAIDLGPWTATLTACALLAYVVPFTHTGLTPLRRFASPFFYAALIVALVNLGDARIGPGRWEIVAAFAVSAVAFGAAAELGAVRLSAIAARGFMSVAWFAGVDALNAAGWRGPFDALLALVYVAAGQARALARHTVATARRRWFVHASAAAAVVLCFTGPEDQIWWRLAAASAALASAYWWLAIARDELELPWLAWSALGAAAGSLAIAAVPEQWQGTAFAGEALALSGAWFGSRAWLRRKRLETSAIVVLGIMGAIGLTLTLREEIPTWAQAGAMLIVAAFLGVWSWFGAERPLPSWRPYERSAASLFAATAVLLGCGVLRLEAAVVGLVLVAAAAAHAEWAVRARNEFERWYALAAMFAAAPVLYVWPHMHQGTAVVAVELLALTAIGLVTAIRARRWYLAVPALLGLAPSLHVAFVAAGAHDRVTEEVGFAVLAWIIGAAGIGIRTRYSNRWAWAIEASGATIACGALIAMSIGGDADPAGIALLAWAPLVYTSAMQDRQRWVLPFAPASAFGGAVVLLASRNADTILYAAALGVLGLLMWALGRVTFAWLGRHPVVDMHRYLGAGSLVVAAVSGFVFPQQTGRLSLGAGLAAFALVVTAAVLWVDSVTYNFRANRYVAIVSVCSAFYFVMRFANFESWELVGPGVGLMAAGISLRQDTQLPVTPWERRLIVAAGLGLAMGWAVTLTAEGDVRWLVTLLVEGSLVVAAGLTLRSRTLLAGGGLALAFASLRALLLIAQAGYLFVAFAIVAVALLAIATALALGRERYLSGSVRAREQMAHWD